MSLRHAPFTHPSASESMPPDVPVSSVEPEDSVQTLSTRRNSSLLSASHHDLENGSGNFKDGKVVSSCRTVLGLRSKPRLRHKKVNQQQRQSPLNFCRMMSTNCWSQSVFLWMKKQYIKFCSNPDPGTGFNAMVKSRRAEVKVSTLSAEQKRELVEGKDKELNTFVNNSVVEAASRQGISPSALMNMRWVVTFKDEGTVGGARLYGSKTWPHPNVFSNRIPSISSDFLDTCCVIWFSNSQRRREVCISSGSLGRATCGRQRR